MLIVENYIIQVLLIGYNLNYLIMPVGKMSFSCKRLHTELASASFKNILSFGSFFLFSFNDSNAICCLAQKVAAAF